MRVLIVEDDEIALELLEHTLHEAGYDVTCARDGLEALDRLRTGKFRLVISDWEMPGMSGLDLCRKIRERPFLGYVYVILVTAHRGERDAIEGLNSGADDFITKPYDPAELCVRLRTGERILALDSRDVTIFALAKLADSRDPETGAHLERIREYSRVLADHLAQQPKYRDIIDGDYNETLYQTSPLHDIGKVGICDDILRKPGRLTAEEFEVMKTHTTIGAETLEAALRKHPEAQFLRMAWEIALTHHEKYDGSGYPQGLCGEQIPLCGRIVALADVYDALTTKRVYKDAFSHEKARAIILEGRGTHFDPDVVDAFLANQGMFLAVHRGLSEDEQHPFDLSTGRQSHGSVLA